MCKYDRIHDRQFSVLRAIRSDLKITLQENIKLPMSPERAVLVFRILDLKKAPFPTVLAGGRLQERRKPLRCEQRGGSLERGSDRLAWSSPGTFPEPEVVKNQGPQQIEVYSRRQLLETATPNHSIDLGPPRCRWRARGPQRRRGFGKEEGWQAGSGRSSSPEGFRLQSFSQPAHPPSVLPPGSKVRDGQSAAQ